MYLQDGLSTMSEQIPQKPSMKCDASERSKMLPGCHQRNINQLLVHRRAEELQSRMRGTSSGRTLAEFSMSHAVTCRFLGSFFFILRLLTLVALLGSTQEAPEYSGFLSDWGLPDYVISQAVLGIFLINNGTL